MDSIDQGAHGIPLTTLGYTNRTLRLEIKPLKGRFEGEMNADGSEIAGTFDQMGSSTTLTLKRTAEASPIASVLTPSAYAPRAGLNLQGYWRATVDFGGAPNRIVLKIAEQTNSSPLVFLEAPDQGMRNIPATRVNYSQPTFAFEVKGIGGRFLGALSESNDEISGDWIQGRRRNPTTFRRGDPREDEIKEGTYSYTEPSELQGFWTGTLNVEGNELRLVIKLGKTAEGGFIGLLNSPDQGIRNMPMPRLSFKNPELLLEMPAARAVYTARFENGKLLGTWQQGEMAYQLDLARTNAPSNTATPAPK